MTDGTQKISIERKKDSDGEYFIIHNESDGTSNPIIARGHESLSDKIRVLFEESEK